MSGDEERFVREAFETNWISTVGPQLTSFEAEFSAYIGMPCVALSSGTAALHLGLRALGVERGDLVFCSTLTFAASAFAIRYQGAVPVFIDSDRLTWNMDPNLLEDALQCCAHEGRLPKAVLVVDLYGQSADMDSIRHACAYFGIPILEDAAEALGAHYKGRPAGTSGDISIFSFNGNKIITTSGGGMLACPNRAMAEKVRYWSQQSREPGIGYEHKELGYNYRMSNVLAAIGRGQLQVLSERVNQRRSIAERYQMAFADLPGLSLMPQASFGLHTRWLSCFLLGSEFGCSRDDVICALDAANVEARPVWKPLHLQPVFSDCRTFGGAVAEDLSLRGVCLPSSSNLSADDQDRVIAAVRSAGRS